MKVTTISPMPKAVPKLVSDTSCQGVKPLRKRLSLARLITAGLSEKKVIRAANAVRPGSRNTGFISGASSTSSRRITPNSLSSWLSAPDSTVMPMMKSTVLSSSWWAVLNRVLTRAESPIWLPR